MYTYPPCGRGNSREAVTSGWQRGVRHAGERVAAWTRLVTAHRVGRAVTLLHLRWAPGRRPWASCSGAALFLFVVEADRSWELLGWMFLLGSGQGSGGGAVAAGGPESCALPADRTLPTYTAVVAMLSGGGAPGFSTRWNDFFANCSTHGHEQRREDQRLLEPCRTSRTGDQNLY